MNGILLVDKPKGWTSHDVVAKVRSLLSQQSNAVRKIKVGHAGTLDPLATGLLVVLVGSYCKRAQEFSKQDKTYEVVMKLGETSTTGDAEGIITPYHYSHSFTRSRETVIDQKKVANVMKSFIGEIKQTPPAYSAIKVNGQRAYKLARAGKDVKLKPRKVKIYEITDVKLIPIVQKSTIVQNSTMCPKVKFTTKVSSGTYIRSLVEDIGKKLGTGAYMSDLKRVQVGTLQLSGAVRELNFDSLKNNLVLL